MNVVIPSIGLSLALLDLQAKILPSQLQVLGVLY